VSSNRLAVVHNALQPPSGQSRKAARDVIEALDPQLRAKILIGWVGRFTAVKGPDLFVRAVAGLAPDTWQAVMVGDGPERAACRALAQSLGVGKDRLRFLGSQPEAARLIGGFDAIVLSSRSEGVPMVLLEAAALGVPVISFAVGGVPEVLPHDGGWLVPPDDPVSLGAAMTAVLGDMTSARARGARVQAVIREKLSFDHWLDQYDRLYDAVVHHARR
jgi:glycosyltransferase involved in cell wall biosynthesis